MTPSEGFDILTRDLLWTLEAMSVLGEEILSEFETWRRMPAVRMLNKRMRAIDKAAERSRRNNASHKCRKHGRQEATR